jgi:quinol monooxygenase YgiN
MTIEADVDPTVFVFVRLHATPGREDDVRAAMTNVVNASRTKLRCVSMHGFRSFRDPRLFFIHSVWKEGHDEPRAVSRTHKVL